MFGFVNGKILFEELRVGIAFWVSFCSPCNVLVVLSLESFELC
jgi:hypothetical protein